MTTPASPPSVTRDSPAGMPSHTDRMLAAITTAGGLLCAAVGGATFYFTLDAEATP